MLCYQCEQTAKGVACTTGGVCGKSREVAALQDLLVWGVTGAAAYAHAARQDGKIDPEIDKFVEEALFATVTNVNFDAARFVELLRKCGELKKKAEALSGSKKAAEIPQADWSFSGGSVDKLVAEGNEVGIARDPDKNEDIRSLQQTLIYGLKGMAAYAHHARELGLTDESVSAFMLEGLVVAADPSLGVDELVAAALKCGEANVACMATLDKAHTQRYGNPTPTEVPLGTKAGPGILISGHDLFDLEELLKQTEGKGINVYTHGEMLPCHGYPELNKYKHLAGNYGGAWQNQQKEFDEFPGPIVMTTNCLMRPRDSYKDRVWTRTIVGWPGVKRLQNRDFSQVIEQALTLPPVEEKADKSILTGFHHTAVLDVADKVIDAVKGGAVKHFFLIGGCDGARPGRNYYTELAEQVPKDCIILTLACGKYRFNKLDFGDIGGIPRLLDVGQCNNAYSAVVIAQELAKAFDCGVNDLPLTLILSWYEQKAVVILLSLLHLGVKNIKLGPSLPAFLTPNVLNVLVENFNIAPISTPQEDLAAALAG